MTMTRIGDVHGRLDIRRNLKEMDEEGDPSDEEILELTKRTHRRRTENGEHVA